jgi:hypothetical protein
MLILRDAACNLVLLPILKAELLIPVIKFILRGGTSHPVMPLTPRAKEI